MRSVSLTKIAAAAVFATAVLLTSHARATPFPGPDGGGYHGVAIANTLQHIDLSGGTVLSLGDDSISGSIALPFTFNFYGSNFSSIQVGNNGFINFSIDNSGLCCNGGTLPSSNFASHIGGLWVDLINNSGTNSPYVGTLGTGSNREFVIGWYNEHEFNNGNSNTFEIILHETSNDIELQYGALAVVSHTATAGIESPDGTNALSLFQSINDGNGLTAFDNTGWCIGTGPATCGIAAPTAVPEPGTLSLLGGALLGFTMLRRRRRKAA